MEFRTNYLREDLLKNMGKDHKEKKVGIEKKTVGEMIDDLITTNIKCFMAQEPGGDLKKAQKLNKRRCQLIIAIDAIVQPNEETRTEKTY